MITQVEATNSRGSILALPLYDVSNGFVVEDIDGLDPVKATIVSSNFAQLDGSTYQSSRRENRNIKLKIGLEPDYATASVKSLRSQLYQYFMPKSLVSLRLIDSSGTSVKISGRVESCESPFFTAEPEMDVSIICFDPDFTDITETTIPNLLTTNGSDPNISINYPGTVDAGIQITLNINQSISQFSIYLTSPDGVLKQMDFSTPLVSGDVVTLTTTPGAKSAILSHSATTTSALYAISPQSTWLQLSSGVNAIRAYANTATPIPLQIKYTSKYGGL